MPAHAVASPNVELLVDADTHSLEQIRNGIAIMTEKYGAVRTSIFAAPGREENRRCRELFNHPGINFRPVSRRGTQSGGEANDGRIVAEMQRLAASRSAGCVALLTSDTDFANAVEDLVACCQHVVVLVPTGCSTAQSTYRYR